MKGVCQALVIPLLRQASCDPKRDIEYRGSCGVPERCLEKTAEESLSQVGIRFFNTSGSRSETGAAQPFFCGLRRVSRMISAGANSRIGGPQRPVPRLTTCVMFPTWKTPARWGYSRCTRMWKGQICPP